MNSHIDRVAQRLLKRAARRAPPLLAERLEGGVARGHGGAAHQRRAPAAGHRLAAGPRASSPTSTARPTWRPRLLRGAKAVAAYVPADPTFFSRRSAAVIAILALHAVISTC